MAAATRPPFGSGMPAGLVPPLQVALARAVARMPRAGALPGSLSYEPKWDGYRCVAIHDDAGVTLWSRQGKELTGYFPELTAALASDVPPGCVVDGEAVIWAGGMLDFSALQQRLGAGPKTLPGLVRQTPASYVAFDVLAVAGHDARALPLSQRRALLEELARGWAPPLSLSPATTDPHEAVGWFEELPQTGIEGLVIKGTDQPYTQGARSWLKLKHRETVEIICGAVIGPITEPREVVAGLVLDGKLRIVGRSTPLKTTAARELARWLQPPLARDRERHHPGPLQPQQGPRRADTGRTCGSGSLRRHGLVRQVLPPPAPRPPRQAGTLPGGHHPARNTASTRRGPANTVEL